MCISTLHSTFVMHGTEEVVLYVILLFFVFYISLVVLSIGLWNCVRFPPVAVLFLLIYVYEQVNILVCQQTTTSDYTDAIMNMKMQII